MHTYYKYGQQLVQVFYPLISSLIQPRRFCRNEARVILQLEIHAITVDFHVENVFHIAEVELLCMGANG